MPVSVATMNRCAGRSRHRADHALGRGDVQTLRLDVAPAHLVDELAGAAALGMHQHLGVRIALPGGVQRLGADALVHVALPHPDLDPPVGPHPAHVGAEEEIGQEEDALVLGDGVDHVEHVAAGAAVVELRLHLRGGVDVAHRDVAGELRLPPAHVLRGDRGGERAAGLEVGQQHPLRGRQDRRGLRHEVHAGEHDHLGVRRGRLPREAERVAHVIGHVLHFRALVVVGDHDGVPAPRERRISACSAAISSGVWSGRSMTGSEPGGHAVSRLSAARRIVEPAMSAAALAPPARGLGDEPRHQQLVAGAPGLARGRPGEAARAPARRAAARPRSAAPRRRRSWSRASRAGCRSQRSSAPGVGAPASSPAGCPPADRVRGRRPRRGRPGRRTPAPRAASSRPAGWPRARRWTLPRRPPRGPAGWRALRDRSGCRPSRSGAPAPPAAGPGRGRARGAPAWP